ncbi:MAG: UDP-N-acetylmuramate dehydrogenase [Treponema sp.]|nr:UDP-N-acetylmuramate dehydrogenase [Treponema sp.]
MDTIRKFIEKINSEGNFQGDLAFEEPMGAHTTFKTGGPADLWIRPGKDIFPSYLPLLFKAARQEGIPLFILGGGANVVFSDRGFRGIVLDTGAWEGLDEPQSSLIQVLSGTTMDRLVDQLCQKGWGGLEHFAGMPGTLGGAVWMNARCYDRSLSDSLVEVEYLNPQGEIEFLPYRESDYGYKQSPFQEMEALILSARLRIQAEDPELLFSRARGYRLDREEKGQYRCPSAGSAFKNNQSFGAPTGMIIDQLGLKGLSRGGAQVAPWHGNLIINTGGATAQDIRGLMEEIKNRVREERGIDLESEILFVGDWS